METSSTGPSTRAASSSSRPTACRAGPDRVRGAVGLLALALWFGAPAASARERHLTIEVNGDLLIHSPVWQRAAALAAGGGYDFAPMLRRIRPYVRRADLALCHVETPMTHAPPAGYPSFNTPPALARAIRRTGWDSCSTASNHTLDRGQAGVRGTLRALDRVGVRHAGSARSARTARKLTLLRTRGIKVAHLAYTTTTNGIAPPHPWSVELADPQRIRRDAQRARRRGAQVVIVNLHWGTEYQHAPDAQQRRLVRQLDRSRAITAIVGQHAHVVQPIRRHGGRWVVYGEGNLLSNQTAACCPAASQDGMLVLLRLRVDGDRSRVERVNYVPTFVRHPDYTVVRASRNARSAALRASWTRTVGVVGRGRRLWPLGQATPRQGSNPRPAFESAPTVTGPMASGTLMSAPMVSGVVALLLEKYRKLTPDQVKGILMASTRLLPASIPMVDGLAAQDKAAGKTLPVADQGLVRTT